LQFLLTSLIVWYVKILTRRENVDFRQQTNAHVFNRIEFERVFNEYARLQEQQKEYVETHADEIEDEEEY
jgi:hypothetical protein